MPFANDAQRRACLSKMIKNYANRDKLEWNCYECDDTIRTRLHFHEGPRGGIRYEYIGKTYYVPKRYKAAIRERIQKTKRAAAIKRAKTKKRRKK